MARSASRFKIVKQELLSAVRSGVGLDTLKFSGLKAMSAIGMYIASFLLAALLGSSKYGNYAFGIGLANIGAALAVAGQDKLIVKQSARKFYNGVARSIVVSSLWTIIVIILLLLVGFASWRTLVGTNISIRILPSSVAALAMLATMRFTSSYIEGQGRIIQARIAETFIRPLGYVVAITSCAVYVKLTKGTITGDIPLYLYAAVCAVAVLYLHYVSQDNDMLPVSKLYKEGYIQIKGRQDIAMSGYFAAIGVLTALNLYVDRLMLGSLSTSSGVGKYDLAARLAVIVTFGLTAINVVLSPRISQYAKSDDWKHIQRLTTWASRGATGFGIVLALAIAVSHSFILGLAGNEYIEVGGVLSILLVGQLINVSSGPSGHLLAMSGYEKHTAMAIGAGVLINILANIVLIPFWGLRGAAVATSSGRVVMSVLLIWYSFRCVGIDPTPVGVRVR